MSKEETAKIDERKLGRYTGILLFALAFCWLFLIASVVFDMLALLWLGLVLFMTVFIAGMI